MPGPSKVMDCETDETCSKAKRRLKRGHHPSGNMVIKSFKEYKKMETGKNKYTGSIHRCFDTIQSIFDFRLAMLNMMSGEIKPVRYKPIPMRDPHSNQNVSTVEPSSTTSKWKLEERFTPVVEEAQGEKNSLEETYCSQPFNVKSTDLQDLLPSCSEGSCCSSSSTASIPSVQSLSQDDSNEKDMLDDFMDLGYGDDRPHREFQTLSPLDQGFEDGYSCHEDPEWLKHSLVAASASIKDCSSKAAVPDPMDFPALELELRVLENCNLSPEDS